MDTNRPTSTRGTTAWERLIRRLVRRETANPHALAMPGHERMLARDEAARRVVRRYALRCGAVGAISGLSVGSALEASIPASAVSTLALQVRMILSIAAIYGHGRETRDLETDVLLIMAGDAAKEVVKRAGIEASRDLAWRALARPVVAPTVRALSPWHSDLVVLTRRRPSGAAANLVPLVGAPLGFGLDWAYARAAGARAIAYYRRLAV